MAKCTYVQGLYMESVIEIHLHTIQKLNETNERLLRIISVTRITVAFPVILRFLINYYVKMSVHSSHAKILLFS